VNEEMFEEHIYFLHFPEVLFIFSTFSYVLLDANFGYRYRLCVEVLIAPSCLLVKCCLLNIVPNNDGCPSTFVHVKSNRFQHQYPEAAQDVTFDVM
jgi:hypothetical protein